MNRITSHVDILWRERRFPKKRKERGRELLPAHMRAQQNAQTPQHYTICSHTLQGFGTLIALGDAGFFKVYRYGDNLTAPVTVDPLLDFGQPLAALLDKAGLRQIDNINDGFGGNETPIANQFHVPGGKGFARLNGRARLEQGQTLVVGFLKDVTDGHIHGSRLALFFANAVLFRIDDSRQDGQVLETQFADNGFHVADRIDAVIDVNDFVTFKGADQVINAIHSGNVRQKGIAQTGSFTGPLDESGNVRHLERGRYNGRWFEDIDEIGKVLVGHNAKEFAGINGAKGIIGRFSVIGTRQQVGQARLADIGQSD
jgi:hypothetical protein